ncbi:MAG TPA: hypothetical protein VHI13_21595 [Candidatus Kapabacteria bacterium]|nr:hypothetical protein [Candidatus Kapabacteria bacterium]
MEKFQNTALQELARVNEAPCISIYLPARISGANKESDMARLKHLLREAEARAVANGTMKPGLLEPARELVENPEFWKDSRHGLALFLSPGIFKTYRVPVPLTESVKVAECFDLLPLLSLGLDDATFFLLSLTQNRIRLYKGTHQEFEEIPLDDSIASLGGFNRHTEWEEEAQLHSGISPTHGNRSKENAVFHGTGSVDERTKDDLRTLFHAVDAALLQTYGVRSSPLVLAGVSFLQAIYRKTSKHPAIADEGVHGNPEHMRPEQLHDAAWQAVEPLTCVRKRQALNQLGNLVGTGKTDTTAEGIAAAAVEGRVKALFIPTAASLNSVGPRENNTAANGEGEVAGGNGEMMRLVGLVLREGGEVFPVAATELPPGAGVAAIMRY